VIRLATACEDFSALRQILRGLEQLCTQVSQGCELSIKACPAEDNPSHSEMLDRWQKQLFTTVRESISAAFPPRLSKDGKAAWLAHMEGYAPANIDAFLNWYFFPIKGFQTQQARLFSFDL
ncbi:Reverse transcriptase, partial [Pseudomonas aeruginosa]